MYKMKAYTTDLWDKLVAAADQITENEHCNAKSAKSFIVVVKSVASIILKSSFWKCLYQNFGVWNDLKALKDHYLAKSSGKRK